MNDLASATPDVVHDLGALYDDYATKVGVVPPAQIGNIPPDGTAPVGP